MKSVSDFVDELINLSPNDTRLFPMYNDCYTSLVNMQKECSGSTSLEDLNLHRYNPSVYFGANHDGISPFRNIDSEAVHIEWTTWWNTTIVSMGYADPNAFLLGNGLELVEGDPIKGDITWNQHVNGTDTPYTGDFDVEYATQVLIYDGSAWRDRRVFKWGIFSNSHISNAAGIFRFSAS